MAKNFTDNLTTAGLKVTFGLIGAVFSLSITLYTFPFLKHLITEGESHNFDQQVKIVEVIETEWQGNHYDKFASTLSYYLFAEDVDDSSRKFVIRAKEGKHGYLGIYPEDITSKDQKQQIITEKEIKGLTGSWKMPGELEQYLINQGINSNQVTFVIEDSPPQWKRTGVLFLISILGLSFSLFHLFSGSMIAKKELL